MTKTKIEALAAELEKKYVDFGDEEKIPETLRSPVSGTPPSSLNLFTLINKNSHMLEKIAKEAMTLSDKFTNFEASGLHLDKIQLDELHGRLNKILAFLTNIN